MEAPKPGEPPQRPRDLIPVQGPEVGEPEGEGAAQLCSVWRDRDFDPVENAFYYARVVENPTCRWSQHLCVDAGVDCANASTVTQGYEACCREDHVPVVQERAWTSPIWYRP